MATNVASASTEFGGVRDAGDRRPDAAILLALIGAALSKRVLTEGVSVGSCFFLAAVLASFRHGSATLQSRRYRFRWPFFAGALVVWSAVTGIAGVLGLTAYNEAFEPVVFMRTASLLVFFAVGGAQLARHVRRFVTFQRLATSVAWAIFVFGIAALALFIVSYFEPVARLVPPWVAGSSRGVRTAYGSDTLLLHRLQGTFSEPSTLGSYMGLSLGLLLIGYVCRCRVSPLAVCVSTACIALTLSPTGYAVTLAAVAGYWVLTFRGRITQRHLGLWTAAAVVAISLVTGVPGIRTAFGAAIVDRASGTIAGTDNSGSARLWVSWEVPSKSVSRSPIVGAGLGMNKRVAERLGVEGKLKGWLSLRENPDGWNTFAYLLGSGGIPMLCIGLGMALSLRREIIPMLQLLVLFMAAASFLEPLVWVYMALVVAPRSWTEM